MPTSPVWKGSSALIELPESPEITSSKDGLVYVKTFKGPISLIISSMPSRLSSYPGVPRSLKVDTVKAKNGPGGIGTLTITCCQSPVSGIVDGAPEPIEEVEWVEVQRPLKSHKMFQAGGDHELDDGDLSDLVAWQNQNDPVAMKAFKFPLANNGGTDDLSDNAKIYARKWLRGQESYNEYAPVFRSTTTLPSQPESGGCGIIGNPDAQGSTPPPYYQWLKNADRVMKRNRTWERIQEWLGAWWWDPDIYGTADTGGSDGGGSDG
jgi:hypothetical protein